MVASVEFNVALVYYMYEIGDCTEDQCWETIEAILENTHNFESYNGTIN